ncbi:MAG: flagellar assembly protein A [Clostridium sp.]
MDKITIESNNVGVENINGTIAVKNGVVIVRNPKGNGEYAKVIAGDGGRLCVNGNKVSSWTIVKETDEIEYTREAVKGKRNINIKTNEDETEASITIYYEAGLEYKIKDSKENIELTLELDEVKSDLPPLYKAKEVIEHLQKNRIIFGIDREKIKLVETDREIKDLCIARSIKQVEPVEDKVIVILERKTGYENVDSLKKIDYKNIISIQSVKIGDVIAEIIKGSIGKDGITIYGKKIKCNSMKKLKIKIGNGCVLQGNKIIATIDGKVCSANNNFKVNKLHNVSGDVDIKSGNINFPGDVVVSGKVTEGMSVIASSLIVSEGAFKTNIEVSESATILGNIFDSKIKVGGQVLDNKNTIENLELLKEELESLLKNIAYLRSKNLIDSKIADGYLIKTLIESKFKAIPKLCTPIILSKFTSVEENLKLITMIKSKLIGLGPASIKSYKEIIEIIEEINNEIENLEIEDSISSDLTIEYCQEGEIEALGDISIIGKGSYTSQIFAKGKIEFTSGDSVCRGGHLKAGELIKVNAVGSRSGVVTELEVEKNGHIYAEIAYHNTVFIVGTRKGSIKENAKDVHVYTDKSGELVIDKLCL